MTDSKFYFGARSRGRLAGVDDRLVQTAEVALSLTRVDFCVVEGRRSQARQRRLVAAGASRTMESKHLKGLALDLAPCIGSSVRWDWPLFYDVAAAMYLASTIVGVRLRWGGVWDRGMDQLGITSTDLVTVAGDLHRAMTDYVARWLLAHPVRGPEDQSGPLLDGPHHELLLPAA